MGQWCSTLNAIPGPLNSFQQAVKDHSSTANTSNKEKLSREKNQNGQVIPPRNSKPQYG